jgi:photosystem II stability/assembly factor-like uncharacterized protein
MIKIMVPVIVALFFSRCSNPVGPEKTSKGWQTANSGLPANTTVQCITADETGKVIYIGAFDGVFKSSDGGSSWTGVNEGLESRDISCIALDPQNTSVIYAGSWGRGVFKSSSSGSRWTSVWNRDMNPLLNAITIGSDGAVWCATEHGLFVSRNSGESWLHAFQYGKIRTVAVSPADQSTIYFGARWHGNFRSSDGGQTWQQINTGVYTDGQEYAAANSFLFIGGNPQHILMSTGWVDLYYSDDGGDEWRPRGDLLQERRVQKLAASESMPHQIWAATESDGIYVSQDAGVAWSDANSGLADLKITTLFVARRGKHTIFAGTLGQGVFKYVEP